MRKNSLTLSLLILFSFLTACCEKEDNKKEDVTAQQTVLMYMPWTADVKMQLAFENNINMMKESVVKREGLGNKRFLVFISTSASTAVLYELKYKADSKQKCVNDTLTQYTGLTGDNYSSQSGLTTFFNDVKKQAPARSYGLIISGHGMGWLPVGSVLAYAKKNKGWNDSWDDENGDYKESITRFFGAASGGNIKYQTEISTLNQAVLQSFGHTDYILFDDCYMQNIETAYMLRNVTDHILASTCEIYKDGLPYDLAGDALLNGNYEGVVDAFYNYYSHSQFPYATFSIVDTSQLEALAALMKTANQLHPYNETDKGKIQKLDGFTGTTFFDMGSYIDVICSDDTDLCQQLQSQLKKAVPYHKHTDYLYCNYGATEIVPIEQFSGITISDPSIFIDIKKARVNTSWWNDTH